MEGHCIVPEGYDRGQSEITSSIGAVLDSQGRRGHKNVNELING